MALGRDATTGQGIALEAMPRYIVTGEAMNAPWWSMPVEAATPEEAVNVAARTTLHTSTYQVWRDIEHELSGEPPLYETVRSGKPIREIHFVRGPWRDEGGRWRATFKYADTDEQFDMHFVDELHARGQIEKYQRWEGRWPLGR